MFHLVADIDECLIASACHPNASCTDTDGSYTCTCNPGFTGDGFVSCTSEQPRFAPLAKQLTDVAYFLFQVAMKTSEHVGHKCGVIGL